MLAAETQKRILILDPESAAVGPLRQQLCDLGFLVRHEIDGTSAMSQLARAPPNLVIFDWNSPDGCAMELIRRARAVRAPQAVRLIIISARASELDVVSGLESGADDYIAKPYSAREVVARVLAVLRPKQHVDRSGALAFDGLELNSVTARVSARGDLINLRGAEYRLLEFLMAHAGRTFSREQLVSQVWGQDGGVDVRTVDVIVQRLRKILTDPGYRHHIQSVRGFGYRFRGPAAGLLPPNRDAARKT